MSHLKSLKNTIDEVGNSSGLKKVNNQIKNNGLSSFSKNVKGLLGIGTFVTLGRRVARTMSDMTKESVDFVETVNLFNVSMGKGLEGLNQYYEKAVKFQNELQEKLGANIEESMNYQALFNSMSKSMGISAKYAYTLSENFTKLGYDLASLYNIDPTNAMQKLRAGLAGQTKPLRDLGLDITQQSLQPIVDQLGIDRSIKNMSQAEKMILRYIAVLKQAQIAQGDFANTMESPSNQLRIFNAQIIAFKRNMGNLWQGFLGGILPYINAIMMVINELLKMVAKLFGFKVSEQNVNISANVGVDDLSDDLGTATGKAKELKAQLMGFDEINNISLQTDSGSGTGGEASVGGIDQRLLDAMKEYDNLMDKVKSKATDIRDKIMNWLGFTKKINPLTGEISWEYTGMSKQAKTILNILKLIAGLYISAKVLKLIGYLKTLKGVLTGVVKPTTSFQNGLASVGTTIKGLKNWFSNLGSWVSMVSNQYKIYHSQGNGVIQSLKMTKSQLDNTGQGFSSLFSNTTKVIGGLAGLVGSSVLAYKSMEDLSNGIIGTDEAIGNLTMSIGGATVSGALIGSIFGLKGAIIGGLLGALSIGISSIIGYKDETDKLTIKIKENGEAIDESTKSIQERNKIAQDTINSQTAEVEYIEKLTRELETLTEANGTVKKGYEDRVDFILNQLNNAFNTEYSLTDGRISQNGELVDSINEITDSIYKTIEAKKAEIVLNANEENYAKAIQESSKHYQEKENAIQNSKKAQENLNKVLEEYGLTMEDYTSGTYDYQKALTSYTNTWTQNLSNAKRNYEDASLAVDESTKNWVNDCKTITDFENLKTASIKGNQEEISKILQEITSSYETESGIQTQTIEKQIGQEIELANYKKEQILKKQGEINTETEQLLNTGIKTLAEKLVEQTKTVEELTPEQKEAWKKLSEGNLNIYSEYLSQVPEKTRKEIQSMTGVFIEKTPEVEQVTNELSEKIVNSLDNSPETRKEAVEAVKSYMQGLSENKQRELLKQCGIDNADKVIEGLKKGELSEDIGINIIKGLNRGLQNNLWQKKALSTAFGFASSILTKMKDTLGIKSPSKKTKQFGIYLLQGLGIGINKESNEVLKTVSDFSNNLLKEFDNPIKELSNGIAVDTKAFSIKASQYIDYGAINGNIATKTNVDMNDNMINQMGQACYNAFVNAMRTEGVKVEIEAKTEEGTLVKKVSKGFNEFIQQTGELPFPVPIK